MLKVPLQLFAVFMYIVLCLKHTINERNLGKKFFCEKPFACRDEAAKRTETRQR